MPDQHVQRVDGGRLLALIDPLAMVPVRTGIVIPVVALAAVHLGRLQALHGDPVRAEKGRGHQQGRGQVGEQRLPRGQPEDDQAHRRGKGRRRELRWPPASR